MSRGRKPKPAAVRRLEGNRSKRKIVEQLKLPVEVPSPPHTLSARSQQHWERLCTLLHGTRILTRIDGDALAMYCDNLARRETLNKILEAEGEIVADEEGGGLSLHPAFKALQDCEKALRWFQVEYGLTASARMKVKPAGAAGGDDKPAANEFDEFLKTRARAAAG